MLDERARKRLLRQLEREIRKEDGYFVLNLGMKRKFPESFKEVSFTNYGILKEMYCVVYEKSLNAYVRGYFAKMDRSVIQLVKYHDTVIEFLFGNEHHLGVYPMYVGKYLEKHGENADVQELIPAVESLFVKGYRIKKTDGGYVMMDPTLTEEVKLEPTAGTTQIKQYDYMGSLTKLLNLGESKKLLPDEKVAALSFELASGSEKKSFNVPYGYGATLVGLDEVLNLGDFRVIGSKISPEHTSVTMESEDYLAINVSFIGKETRNYFWLLADYAEHRMVEELGGKYGFVFVQNLPSRYVVDHDGYLVSKFVIMPKASAVDTVNYFPLGAGQAYSWVTAETSSETSKRLRSELATFYLLQFALGNDEVDETSVQTDTETRRVMNMHHSGRSYLRNYVHKAVPNELVRIKLDQSMNKMLDWSELRRAVDDTLRIGSVPAEFNGFFGFAKGASVNYGEPNVGFAGKVDIESLPANLLFEESGVFRRAGRALADRDEGIYETWFAQHLVASGIPEYSEPYLVLCNRFALLAMLTHSLAGKR